MTGTATSNQQTDAVQQLLDATIKLHHAGQVDVAHDLYLRVLGVDPTNSIAWHHLGLAVAAKGDVDKALTCLDKSIAADPLNAFVHSDAAILLRRLGKHHEAAARARQATSINPQLAAAHSNLGAICEDLGDLEAALAAYENAVRCDPRLVEAHINAADVLRRLGRDSEALDRCDLISALDPAAARPHLIAGRIWLENAAEQHPAASLPTPVAGRIWFDKRESTKQAIACFQKAVEKEPLLAIGHYNLGHAFRDLNKVSEAKASYQRAVELDPSLIAMRVHLHHERRIVCDWTNLEAIEQDLLAAAAASSDAVPAFPFLNLENASPELQLFVGRKLAGEVKPAGSFEHLARSGDARKIKLGYLSSDLRSHAMGLLTADLFERHDRSKFEVIAYSHGNDDKSELRRRLALGFDDFVDISEVDNASAATRIHSDNIDILIDLNGYTKNARTPIVAARPAPIQVSYIGFPGTLGLDAIDYIIGDPIVTPIEHQPFYSEKIVQLKDCYLPHDPAQRIAEYVPTRADFGLPEKAFIFCCLNDNYKISPRLFSLWMRLLKAIPDAVLWLFVSNDEAKTNLAAEALLQGIDSKRIFFATRMGNPEHLTRFRLADLFLDCFPYNGHTTTSDALWMGLPVLTMLGSTFASRVAASLLTSIGLPELITATEQDYESMARHLAIERSLLSALRNKLSRNRLSYPIFEASRLAAQLEAAYLKIFDLWSNGERPQTLAAGSY